MVDGLMFDSAIVAAHCQHTRVGALELMCLKVSTRWLQQVSILSESLGEPRSFVSIR